MVESRLNRVLNHRIAESVRFYDSTFRPKSTQARAQKRVEAQAQSLFIFPSPACPFFLLSSRLTPISPFFRASINGPPASSSDKLTFPSFHPPSSGDKIGSIHDPFGRTTTSITPRVQTIRVDPTTLGTNDHHDHLEGSLGYPRPPTLPQNSIGSLRGDVQPRLVPVGSVHPSSRVCCYHSGLFKPKQPKPDPPTVQPDS
ncbi:hypothetical protein CRG98_008768 [Punica granatum]|uniref:Uncharacterized protein n=1 Tax=Punica granatum TaxID=22663 RepID=A0A2I0KQY7_PUNGR|nr:hypothetical protein CRG98_008768 [Punica granatum]